MTPRLVMYLAIAALVSAGAAGAVWRSGHVAPVTAGAGDRLLPGLVNNVNAVTSIHVREGAKALMLARGDGGWTVAPSGYPVKAGKLQQVLVGLARLTKIALRTASAAKYASIEVSDAGEPQGKSRQVTLKGGDGQVIGDIILGKAASGFTSGAEEAQYVRIAGQAQSWLVRGSVSARSDLKDWVDTTVMKINTGTVEHVEFRHGDGEILTLSKAGKDAKGNDRFEVQGLPDGIKVKDEQAVRYGATDLANVDFTDVRKATGAANAGTRVLVETDTGLKISYDVINEDGQTWLQVAVEEKGSDETAAARISKRVDGWQFAIADYKAKQFSKRLSDFLNMQQ